MRLVLRALARALARRESSKWFVFSQIPLAILAVACTAWFLKLDMNRDHLVGAKRHFHQLYLQFREEFPGEDELVAVIESGNAERSRQFIERLAARIKPDTRLFTDLFYKGDLTTLGPKALLLVPPADLEQMRQALRNYRPFIQDFAQANNLDALFSLVNARFRNAGRSAAATSDTPSFASLLPGPDDPSHFGSGLSDSTLAAAADRPVLVAFSQRLAPPPQQPAKPPAPKTAAQPQAPPFLDALPFLQRLIDQATQSILRPGIPPPPGIEGIFGGGPEAEQQAYVTFARGRIYVLTVRPRSEEVIAPAIDRLRQAIQQTRIEVPGVDAGLTGGPVLDYDEMQQSEHDSIVASATALVLCSLIFIIAYGEVRSPLKAALCLLVGLAFTMGFTTLAIGHLNILTITFAPMLIGLAIDFGIHFITRFEEEVRRGDTRGGAVQKATVFTGQGIVTGAFTTAAAFLAMALTDFKGIREMGIISGGGLLLCLVPMMTLLPALLVQRRPEAHGRRARQDFGRRTRIEDLWLRPPWVAIGATVLLCAAAVPLIPKVHFDYNLLHMQSQSLPSVAYEKKLMRSADRSAIFGAVIADSLPQARELEARIKQLPSVAGVDSAADLLAPDQEQRLRLARAIKAEVAGIHFAPVDRRPVPIHELSATLFSTSGYLGLAAGATARAEPALSQRLVQLRDSITQFRKVMIAHPKQAPGQLALFQQALFTEVHRTFAALRNQDTGGPLHPANLPRTLHDRFIGVTGKYLLQVYPRKDIWQHENQREFITELQSVAGPERVTGTPVEYYEYTTLLKNSYEQAALYSLAAIAVMIFLHFRSLLSVVLALLPVGIGSVWLLGFMGLAGISFNPANIMTLPLVVGIGVTNGIQVLNRFAEEGHPRIFAKSTGKAVLVSGLTTITGFGTLMLAKHQGIQSLGEVMSFGIAACMIAALTFLPALLSLLIRWGWTIKAHWALETLAHEPSLPGRRPELGHQHG